MRNPSLIEFDLFWTDLIRNKLLFLLSRASRLVKLSIICKKWRIWGKKGILKNDQIWSSLIQFGQIWSNLIRNKSPFCYYQGQVDWWLRICKMWNFDQVWSSLIQFGQIWSNLIRSPFYHYQGQVDWWLRICKMWKKVENFGRVSSWKIASSELAHPCGRELKNRYWFHQYIMPEY